MKQEKDFYEIEKYVYKTPQQHALALLPRHPKKLKQISLLTKKIEELNTHLIAQQNTINRLEDSENIIKYLEDFKDNFTFHCVVKGQELSILQCSELQSLKPCKFRNKCKGRLALGQKLRYLEA